jgi:CHAT domain-containing protein/tetratricopeptide (TPR) repeat protein
MRTEQEQFVRRRGRVDPAPVLAGAPLVRDDDFYGLSSAARWCAFAALVVFLVPGLVAAAGRQSQAGADADIARAEALHRQSEFRKAEEALTRLRGRGDLSTLQRARVLMRLAAAQVELGRHEDALRTAADAQAPARAADATDLLIRLEIVRGSAWRQQGFPLRGRDHYARALELAERARHDTLRGEALNMLSNVHQSLGDWARVLDYAERAFQANPNPSDDQRFSYHTNRGIAYYEFHDRDRAEHSFRQSLEIATRIGARRSQSYALGELGLVAWEFDRDRTRALDYYDRAAAIAREIGVTGLEATWLNNAGNVYRDSGELAEALDRYRRAFELSAESNRARQPVHLKNIGQVLSMLGRPAEAEGYLLKALAGADQYGNATIKWQARMELGGLYAKTDPARAIRYFDESLELLETTQSRGLLEGFRAGMLGRALARYDPYDQYIQFLLERGDAATAFTIAERARARVFLETLTAARDELAAEVPPAYLQAETSLLQSISDRQRRLRNADLPPEERRTIASDIDAAEDELGALRLRLAVDHPSLADSRFPRIWSSDDVRGQLLARDEALVMFFLGRRASWGWIVDDRGTEVVRLPARGEIEPIVRRLLPTLQSPETAVDRGAREWLSRTLVAPVLARVPEHARLVIVPHAILSYVPFEVLADERGRYLVERNTVSYAPSVSSLAFLRQRAGQSARGSAVVAVGSPVLAAPGRAGERAAPLEWVGLLKPLPYSGAELQRIADLFDSHARVLDGPDATEEALRTAGLGEAGILHFATHALIDEERPERSGLALSPGGAADGILQMREIYGFDLEAALVTLSACQTALGREVTGEGLVGMARAFFYAGANAVAASLWNVSDRSTADLMVAFYDGIRAGAPVDRALADAKRAFLRDGGDRGHPYYWAPFIVVGHSGATMTFPETSSFPWAVVAVLLTLAAAVTLSVHRWKRQTRAAPRA